MRILLLTAAIVVILGGAAGVLSLVKPKPVAPSPTPTSITFKEDNRAAQIEMVLTESRRVLVCRRQGCESKIAPETGDSRTVFASGSWFFYQNDQLVRLPEGENQPEVLVAQTKLVGPRELFISPDGTKLAYFLDNIHDPKQELTELWYLDTTSGERHLVAEHLRRPDVLTTPRWNSSSTHLTFIADSGGKNEDKIEYIVAAVNPPSVAARFAVLNWQKVRDQTEDSLTDVSFTGRSLALVEKVSDYRANLTIVHEGSPPQTSVIRGQVPFMEWLSDGRLLYAVQDDTGASLWNVRSTIHTFVGRFPGQLRAARQDVSGEFIVAVMEESNRASWSVFHITSGAVVKQNTVPESAEIAILTAYEAEAEKPKAAGISTVLEDAEVTAFIQANIAEITKEPTAFAYRIITTAEPNVVYVDYTVNVSSDHRLLLTVRDAVHPEWSIRGRYEPAGGEWHRTQGGGVRDPAPKRVYEWEKSLSQWVLKSEL